MKTNPKLLNEFSVEELEARFEMKKWVVLEPCDNPEHCHNHQT